MDQKADEQRLRELMVAYQAGAYDAFEGLYAALIGPVRGWLTGLTRDRTVADDLAQETFLQLHRARRTYDPSFPVMPWVMAIARHVYLMHRRTASRRPRYVAAVRSIHDRAVHRGRAGAGGAARLEAGEAGRVAPAPRRRLELPRDRETVRDPRDRSEAALEPGGGADASRAE